MAEYKIQIKTGDLYKAGTDHTVKIEIVGTLGKTSLRTLDSHFKNEFERDQKDEFIKEDKDVGSIEFIGLLVKPSLIIEQPWFVKTIKIRQRKGDEPEYGEWEKFPIRHPINN